MAAANCKECVTSASLTAALAGRFPRGGPGGPDQRSAALKPRWKTSRSASLRIGRTVKDPSLFWVIPALVT